MVSKSVVLLFMCVGFFCLFSFIADVFYLLTLGFFFFWRPGAGLGLQSGLVMGSGKP